MSLFVSVIFHLFVFLITSMVYANECDCLTAIQAGVQVLQTGGVSRRSGRRAAWSGVLRDGGRGGG